jgi:hypothetical protein
LLDVRKADWPCTVSDRVGTGLHRTIPLRADRSPLLVTDPLAPRRGKGKTMSLVAEAPRIFIDAKAIERRKPHRVPESSINLPRPAH